MIEKLQSIFASGNKAAICLFEIDTEKTYASFLSSWQSSPEDADIIAAALRYGSDSKCIVNPAPHSEKSFLKPPLARAGFEDVRISKVFEPIEGRIIVNELLESMQLRVSSFEGWPRLQATLNRETPAPEAMAMLQGAIEFQRDAENRVAEPYLSDSDSSPQRRDPFRIAYDSRYNYPGM